MIIQDIDNDYPIDSFPIIPRKAIRELARNVQAPVGLIALSVLSAMASATQRRVKVILPIGGAPKPVSLFTMVVAESGDRKTAVDNLVWRPLFEYDERVEEKFGKAMQQYQVEFRVWSIRERNLLRSIGGGEDETEN